MMGRGILCGTGGWKVAITRRLAAVALERRFGVPRRRKGLRYVSFFQNPSGVAASRQSAANLLFPSKDCGALPRRRYGVLQLAHVARTFLSASSGDFPVPVLKAIPKCAGPESGAPFRGAEPGTNGYADAMRATFLAWARLAIAGCSLMLGAALMIQTAAAEQGTTGQPAFDVTNVLQVARLSSENPNISHAIRLEWDRLVGKPGAGTVRFEG